MSGNDALRRRGRKGREVFAGPKADTPRGDGKGNLHAAATADMMGYATDQLLREGVPEASLRGAAAQLVGQATMESGLNPNKSHDPDRRTGQYTGFGIYGARLDRRNDMFAWLVKNGYARNSPEGQMRYMAHEAMTGHRGRHFGRTRGILMRGGTNYSDTRAITEDFESPQVTNDRSGAVGHAYRTGPLVKTPPMQRPHAGARPLPTTPLPAPTKMPGVAGNPITDVRLMWSILADLVPEHVVASPAATTEAA